MGGLADKHAVSTQQFDLPEIRLPPYALVALRVQLAKRGLSSSRYFSTDEISTADNHLNGLLHGGCKAQACVPHAMQSFVLEPNSTSTMVNGKSPPR